MFRSKLKKLNKKTYVNFSAYKMAPSSMPSYKQIANYNKSLSKFMHLIFCCKFALP